MLLMRYGHDPRDVDDYPWRDVWLFAATSQSIRAGEHPLGDPQ